MKKVSIEKLIIVNNLCQMFSSGKLSKFSYGCKRVADKLTPILKNEFDEVVNEKRINLAITGEKGEILVDEKNNARLTPEKLIELNRFSKELQKKELEVELYQITDIEPIKEDLNTLEMFNGIIIDVDIEAML